MGALRGWTDTPAHELASAEEFSRNFNLPFVKPDLGLIYCQNYPDKECFQPLSHPMSRPQPTATPPSNRPACKTIEHQHFHKYVSYKVIPATFIWFCSTYFSLDSVKCISGVAFSVSSVCLWMWRLWLLLLLILVEITTTTQLSSVQKQQRGEVKIKPLHKRLIMGWKIIAHNGIVKFMQFPETKEARKGGGG